MVVVRCGGAHSLWWCCIVVVVVVRCGGGYAWCVVRGGGSWFVVSVLCVSYFAFHVSWLVVMVVWFAVRRGEVCWVCGFCYGCGCVEEVW